MSAINDAVKRRQCINKQAAALMSQTNGPIRDPLNESASDFENCCRSLLRVSQLQLERNIRLLVPTTQSVPFLVTNEAPVNVIPSGSAGGVATLICSIKADETYFGVLEHIAFDVEPNGAFADIAFQIRIGNEIYKKFNNNVFRFNSLKTPYHFPMKFISMKTVSIYAINTGTYQANVHGLLQGWLEPTVAGS